MRSRRTRFGQLRSPIITAEAGGAAPTAPAAFTAPQWAVLPAGTGQATFNILTLPNDGGSAITALQYRLTTGGSWIAFAAATTGSYTVGGFTDGVATDVFVRAVNAVGAGNVSDTKSVTTSAGTAPSAFTIEQWGVINFGSGTARIGVQFLPAAGSSALTRLDYRVNGGAWQTLTNNPAIAEYTVTGLVDGAYRNIEIAAVSAVGRGAASDVKKVWTGVGVMPQVAYYGAKTLAGGGSFRPLDHTGTPVNLTTTPAPVPATSGIYTANITTTGPGTGLTFTGGAGAPNGATFTVALAAGGTVALEIQTIPNMFHFASIQQGNTAFASAGLTLGDHLRFRAGDHNLACALLNWNRASNTPGTWTGTSDIRQGNWVVATRDPCHPTRIGTLQIGQGGNNFDRYVRVHDLDFFSQAIGNTNGKTAGSALQLDMTGNSRSTAHFAVTNCRFNHDVTITGLRAASAGNNIGPLTAIELTGGPFWVEGNTINGCFRGIDGNTYNSTANSYIIGNTIRKCQADGILIGTCNGLLIQNNVIVDKVHPHFAKTVTAVTPGATTVFTFADTTNFSNSEWLVFSGFTGDFAVLNGRLHTSSGLTATTVTADFNSTGLVWNGSGGVVACSSTLHGDYIQFRENLGVGQGQNNVTIRGNRLDRGFADGHNYPDGQGIFMGNTGATDDRTGWVIEGNIVHNLLNNGIAVSDFVNGIIRSNTVIRVLGIDGATVNNQRAFIIITNGSGNIVRDNLANGYTLNGVIENTNNVQITLTTPTDAVPALPANITLYQSHFVAPQTVPDGTYVTEQAFAVRTSGGAQGNPPVFAGAHYVNWATGAYTNPR